MEEKYILIRRCPHCSETHNYIAEIARSISCFTMGKKEMKNITKLFSCPIVEQDFEAVLSMEAEENEHITINISLI
jgi:hypothetical protein